MLPGGTITFLFTDIVGSTARWESDPEGMKAALAEHNAILNDVIQENQGKTFAPMGLGTQPGRLRAAAEGGRREKRGHSG